MADNKTEEMCERSCCEIAFSRGIKQMVRTDDMIKTGQLKWTVDNLTKFLNGNPGDCDEIAIVTAIQYVVRKKGRIERMIRNGQEAWADELLREEDVWPKFINFANKKRSAIGSMLENGHPLLLSNGLMEIGYPAGSFNLTFFADDETLKAAEGLATEYFGVDFSILVTELGF